MTGLYCLFILAICTSLFNIGSKYPDSYGSAVFRPLTFLGIIVFSLFVGLRYNPEVDPDFLNYWEVVQYGPSLFEYHRFELFPRLLVDLVTYFRLSPSAWFIIMGGVLAFFTLFAACRLKNRSAPIVFGGLLLLYFSFDMNVMRQGIAISIFLCAVTYIGERDWKRFLFFMLIAFCFHKSSIIWMLSYFLTFLNWKNKPGRKLLLVMLGAIVTFFSIDFFIQRFSFIFSILGKESVSALSELDLMEVDKGSGVGVILRYIRWFFLMYYIPKIAKRNNDANLYCIFALFIMGVVMDIYSMHFIILSRIALYPKIAELLLYPYLLDNCKNLIVRLIFTLQVIVLTYVLYGYLNAWNFV